MLEDIYKNNKPLFIALVIIMLVLGAGVAIFSKVSKNPTTIDDEIGAVEEDKQSISKDAEGNVYVHITGAVKRPGLYKIPFGSRVAQVIKISGGFLPLTQTDEINLAEILKDGQKIMVPFVKTQIIGNGRDAACRVSTSPSKNIVNINTADEAALDSLPGIGPSTAKKIVEHRNTNGSFKAIEELKNVPGIREKKFEKIKNLITVN